MQLIKLRSGIKNSTQVTLNLSSNAVGASNDENSFPYKLLLTNTKISKIRKDFPNGSSANIKFSKTQLTKMVEFSGILMPGDLPYLSNIIDSFLKEADNMDLNKTINEESVKKTLINSWKFRSRYCQWGVSKFIGSRLTL